ncbi:putative ribonuclease H-like domain-containing protein [Tanacetum coccineum]
MIRNKVRLVAQGYTQEEGINYDEVFAPVARIKAIRLFLSYASFKDFMVYQMDVESSFLYRKIKEEVYVCQPPGFEDPNFPVRVYKVEKAMYGLHQALRAWYETLSTYLLDNEFQRGKINKTLFIKRYKGDILLVQVYMDDIIFGSTKKELCNAFEKLMHEKFQMSSMGELTFFLGLQVEQKNDGRFISQDKYVGEILKKFRFTEVKTASTPIETQKPLLKDEDGEEVDVHMYSSQLWFIMCILTSSRPDIMFAVCACARYQVNPKVSHLHDVKRIFRYLNGQPKLGLWYPKDSPFDLVAYTDSDYARASLDRKSTTGEKAKKSVRLMIEKLVIKENRQRVLVRKRIERIGINLLLLVKVNAARHNLLLLVKVNAARHKLTTAGENEAVYKELDDSLVRAATTSSSLEAKQDNGGGPRRQETMGDTIAQTRFENVSKHSNNLLLRVFDLETTKTTQGNEITSLKRRVKKLKEKNRSRTHKLKRIYKVGLSARVESFGDEKDLGEDASKQGMIADIDDDARITLVSTHFDVDTDMFGVHDLAGDEVVIESEVVVKACEKRNVEEVVDVAQVSTAATTETITTEEITLAQALAELKSAKPKVKGIVFQEPQEERLAREKAQQEQEANVALTEE